MKGEAERRRNKGAAVQAKLFTESARTNQRRNDQRAGRLRK